MRAITFKGNPLEVLGPEIRPGQAAPEFRVQKSDMSDYTLAFSAGKTRVFASLPSLDTPVCDTETRRFNQEALKIPGVEVVCVSMDLPFALKRWCGAAGIDKLITASDHREASFGEAYGCLVSSGPLDRLLCRAVFVVGPDNKVRHVEYVNEIASEPDYAAALAAAETR
ncbi:MAG: thiol peroxidase [Planctomycetota bacterium]